MNSPGFILGANATFSHSDADFDGEDNTSRSLNLPGQSDMVGNVMVGWENDKTSLRLSGNYKSNYLLTISGDGDSRKDQYVESQFYLDFNAGYFVTPQVQVTFQAQNITDENYHVYSGSESYNLQNENYGPTYILGVTLTNY